MGKLIIPIEIETDGMLEWIEVTLERGLEVPEPKGRLMYA